jgi:hypothetical protein
MQIIVEGIAPVAQSFTVTADATVEQLKLIIEDQTFIPSSLMALSNGSKLLACGSLDLLEGDVVTLNVSCDAGMRAKWRKKRMRRLRRKRRKMRQRAR